MKQPAVYILASRHNGTLYTGVTSDLIRRVWEHRNDLVEGFTTRYRVHRLVYFELHDDMRQAIQREKQIKKWNRAWKIELIEKSNPKWQDLWSSLVGDDGVGDSASAGDPAERHTRESGHPESGKRMDSRLRGNDGGGRGEP